MTHFDLVIIGSGSGNTVITPEMADWRIAVIEESVFGGTCLNVGCIPTKMYVYAADVAETVRRSPRYGVDGRIDAVRWPDIRDRIFGRIDPKSAGGRDHRADSGQVTLYDSHAEFVSADSLRLADGRVVSGDRIVIASGSRAVVPDMVTASGVPFHTSDTIMRLDGLPRRLAILGAGYIAAEFAHVFAALGSEVTVLGRGPRLLTALDTEISRRFTDIARMQWDVRLGIQVASLTVTGDAASGAGAGGAEIQLALDDGTVVLADTLLLATGRRPNSDRLGLDAAGVEVHPSGLIVVDEFQRTSVEGVWALGDVSADHQLKHVANQDARVVAHNLVHPDALIASNHRHIPSAIFTSPQIASVGLTEEQAADEGIDYTVAVQEYGNTAFGWAMEDTTSVVKLIAQRGTGRLLGAHLMGPNASILVQPLIQALAFGQNVTAVARGQYWIHPALTEVIENALLKLDLTPSEA